MPEADGGASDAAPRKRIRNLTDDRIEIRGRASPPGGESGTGEGASVVLPPFGEVVVEPELFDELRLDEWRSRRLVETGDADADDEPRASQAVVGLVFGLAVWGLLALLIWEGLDLLLDAVEGPSGLHWTAVVLALVLGLFAVVLAQLETRRWFEAYRQSLSHYLTQFAAIGIAFGLPLAVIQAAGGIQPVEAWGYRWLGVGAVVPAVLQGGGGAGLEHVLGRGLQLLFIGTVAALPALFFFLFDRRKVDTVRQTFFRSVLRIDPTLESIADVESVYGAQVDEVLGQGSGGRARGPGEGGRGGGSGAEPGESSPGRGDASRLLRSHRAIILVATLLVTLGWLLTLDPVGRAPDGDGLTRYFAPSTEPWILAFLGAYTFTLGTLLRRYVRSDLKPKAYAQICMRIVTVVALVWTLEVVFTPDAGWSAGTLGALAFLAGMVPETGQAALHGLLRSQPLLVDRVPALGERYPLDLLDGMNLYHRSRLLDEGIENLENLAHAELPDLLLATRIPLPTLLDWLDQAVLYLHLSLAGEDEDAGRWDRTALDRDIATLRRYGIRTATDLEASYRRARERDAHHDPDARTEGAEVRALLAVLGPEEGEPKRLSVVLDAIHDDEWMVVLRQSRRLAAAPRKPVRTEPEAARTSIEDVAVLLGPDRRPGRTT